MANSSKSPAHVVIFPYDEHGHVVPAFALGRALAASRGIPVTGVLTASRYANGPLPPSETALFHIVTIPNSHAVQQADESYKHDVCYQHSLQKLEAGFEEMMRQLQPPPSCLMSDILLTWTQDLADRLRIPRFQIDPYSALTTLLLLYSPTLYTKGLLPFQPGMEGESLDFLPFLPRDFRLGDVPVDFLSRDLKQLDVLFNILRVMKRAAGVVINTVYELESEAVDAIAASHEVGLQSVYTLGSMSSLLQEEAGYGGQSSPATIDDDKRVISWLDTQPRASVVYVAIGSMVTLTEEEIEEMAWGLEACGQPFLWVIRSRRDRQVQQQQAINDDNDMDVAGLPAGFMQRNCKRGRVVEWVPDQAAALAHPSVGCFITHCGMGSLLEAVSAGVAMIGGFCKMADLNTSRCLLTNQWQVAIPLSMQDPGHGSSLRSCVVSCVKEVFHGDRGRALSTNASKLKAMMSQAVSAPHGSSYLNLTKLANTILSSSTTTPSE